MGVRPWICITWLFLNDSSCLFSKKKTQDGGALPVPVGELEGAWSGCF